MNSLCRILCAGCSKSFLKDNFPQSQSLCQPSCFQIFSIYVKSVYILHNIDCSLLWGMCVCLCHFLFPLVPLPWHVCFPFAKRKETEATVSTLTCSADSERSCHQRQFILTLGNDLTKQNLFDHDRLNIHAKQVIYIPYIYMGRNTLWYRSTFAEFVSQECMCYLIKRKYAILMFCILEGNRKHKRQPLWNMDAILMIYKCFHILNTLYRLWTFFIHETNESCKGIVSQVLTYYLTPMEYPHQLTWFCFTYWTIWI